MSKRPRREASSSPSSLPDADRQRLPSPTPPPKYTRSSHSPSATNMPSTTSPQPTITCTLPSCPHREHSSIESFESHYDKHHTNRCHDCFKNFPTARILECHIRENHDMFAVVAREKGEKIFACFVEDCDKVCISPGKRRAHLVDKHYYHKNFNFFIVNDGIDRATSLLTTSPQRKSRTRVRRVSETLPNTANANTPPATPTRGAEKSKLRNGNDADMDIDLPTAAAAKPQNTPRQSNKKHTRSASEPSVQATNQKEPKMEKGISEDPVMHEEKGQVDGTNGKVSSKTVDNEDTDMTDLTSRMSAIRFVPPSVVRFGRRGGGVGFSKK
ncbi:hypothetical protein ABW20_dc0104742 [Dactylellina cionopaga]|nr:hypothetical protein ABW20_dc0104742 [Dactylellina cionopaga]